MRVQFEGMSLEKTKYAGSPAKRKNIALYVTLKDKDKKETFYWYPKYKELKCILHCLVALHGKDEVSSRVLNGGGLLGIYNNQIEKVMGS